MTHPLISADISIFSLEISKFFYIKKYSDKFHFNTSFLILSNFAESLRIVLVNMVTILMMSVKMAKLGLLKIVLFLNNSYDVIISDHDVTIKALSCDSNYTVSAVM